jgi:UDP-N-acetylmuramoyl-tripeptide--D-alanyl-D-alanine ligase
MIRFTAREMLQAIGADVSALSVALMDRAVAGVSIDTRSIRPGDVFFGIRGDRFDGGVFAYDALRSGAVFAVVNADTSLPDEPSSAVVKVPDAVRALGSAARAYRGRYRGMVAAITGTNGKTTVKDMLLAILRTGFRTHGTSGNLNNHIGLPLSVLGLDESHERAVFELGMNAPGEISYLARIAAPDVGVVLNAGPGHMEFFRTLDGVADAKMELVRALEPGATAVMNADDPMLRAREGDAPCRIVRFGTTVPCDFRGEDVEVGPDGRARFRVEGRTIRLGVPGRHNVSNALAAWAAGRIMGADGDSAAAALESFTASKMRMQIVERDGIRIIDDTYNANPPSMRAAAETLAAMKRNGSGRLIVALGDMRELGAISDNAHREAGRRFAALKPALLLLVGGQAARYREGALEAGMNPDTIRTFGDAVEALSYLKSNTHPGDTLFVKGSRALGMERLIQGNPAFASPEKGLTEAHNKAS